MARGLSQEANFVVEDLKGPLADGEIDRAVAWGRALARSYQEMLADATRPRS